MKALLAACLLASAVVSASAHGDSGCTPGVEAALRKITPKQPVAGTVVSAHCKPWPPSAGREIAAVMAFEQPAATPRQGQWIIALALLDARSQRLLHSKHTVLQEDATTAIDAQSLSLDTARYEVRPGVRALGLRFRTAARLPTGADAWWGNELMLFVPEGPSWRFIFGSAMSAQEAVQGALNINSPGAFWDNIEMTLAVADVVTNGWNDLVVTETRQRDGVPGARFSAATSRRQYAVRYNGDRYQLLAKPMPFWSEVCCSFRW